MTKGSVTAVKLKYLGCRGGCSDTAAVCVNYDNRHDYCGYFIVPIISTELYITRYDS